MARTKRLVTRPSEEAVAGLESAAASIGKRLGKRLTASKLAAAILGEWVKLYDRSLCPADDEKEDRGETETDKEREWMNDLAVDYSAALSMNMAPANRKAINNRT